MRRAKLCVCGRSQRLPLCDNSHVDEDWSCARPEARARWGFCASYHFENLAHKLASHFQGVFCEPHLPAPRVDTMVWLVDRHDLELPLRILDEGLWRRGVVLALDGSGGLMQSVFTGCEVIEWSDHSPLRLFAEVRGLLDEAQRHTIDAEYALRAPAPERLRSGFLCHAVADEPTIDPVARLLRRHFDADLFVCSDSISTGTDWQAGIQDALRTHEVFVFLISEASVRSLFCAFEVGLASALEKPFLLCSLDGAMPPPFIQHMHAIDLPRAIQQRPWFDLQDALLEVLLDGLRAPL